MAGWTRKKTNMNLAVTVSFLPFCRINRHGTKVADVHIDCRFEETVEKADLKYYAKCRVSSKKKMVSWEFPNTCSDAISNKVISLFSEEEIYKLFDEMERD